MGQIKLYEDKRIRKSSKVLSINKTDNVRNTAWSEVECGIGGREMVRYGEGGEWGVLVGGEFLSQLLQVTPRHTSTLDGHFREAWTGLDWTARCSKFSNRSVSCVFIPHPSSFMFGVMLMVLN